MPYHDPEFDDPQELMAIELPGDEGVTREMAEAFADEFARLGLDRAQILALYRSPFYAGAHQAWRLLGGSEIERIVDESVSVWGRIACRIVDRADETAHGPRPRPLRVVQQQRQPRGSEGNPSMLFPDFRSRPDEGV
jgi:hypothetical protein